MVSEKGSMLLYRRVNGFFKMAADGSAHKVISNRKMKLPASKWYRLLIRALVV